MDSTVNTNQPMGRTSSTPQVSNHSSLTASNVSGGLNHLSAIHDAIDPSITRLLNMVTFTSHTNYATQAAVKNALSAYLQTATESERGSCHHPHDLIRLVLRQRATQGNGATLPPLDLRGINLSGADLRGMDLSGIDLSGANLNGANLSHANLSHANLHGANLSQANLTGADLRGVDLHWVILLWANLSGVDLSGMDLSGIYLTHANLMGANLSKANLSGVILQEANLSGVILEEANLSKANLSKANLTGANLMGATLSVADLRCANLTGVYLRMADLTEANLSKATLTGAKLDFATLTGAKLYKATLDQASLNGTDLTGTTFREVTWGTVLPQTGLTIMAMATDTPDHLNWVRYFLSAWPIELDDQNQLTPEQRQAINLGLYAWANNPDTVTKNTVITLFKTLIALKNSPDVSNSATKAMALLTVVSEKWPDIAPLLALTDPTISHD